MGNIFIETDKNDIINRIDELHPNSKPMWGKMSVAQMLAHSIVPVKVALGEAKLKHNLIGKIFGKMAKRQLLAAEQMKKGLPTDPNFVIKNEPDFYASQQGLKEVIENMVTADKTEIISRKHPFFGKMTIEEWGILNYKHLDHHLRQFGV